MGTVTVHYYKGLVNLRKSGATQFSSDSVQVLVQPRLAGGGSTTISTGAAVALDAAPSGTELAVLSLGAGERAYVEVVNEASPVSVADSDSPVIEGEAIIQMNSGWSLSVLEV